MQANGEGKRSFRGFAAVLGAAVWGLLGCPLYEEQCDSRNDCASGYACDPFSRRCEPVSYQPGCQRPDHCEPAETCTPDFICRPGSCEYHGCVSAYRCAIAGDAHACIPATQDASFPPAADASAFDSGADDGGLAPPAAELDAAPATPGDAAADASF